MAELSWGKPKVEVCAFVNGVMPTTPVWTEIANIKEDSTKFSTTKGTALKATLEGGEVLAMKSKASEYKLELEVIAIKGATKPIADVDGVIDTNYAVRLTPENDKLEGFIFPNSFVQVEDVFSGKDGKTWKYSFDALKPVTGAKCQPYTKAV